MRGLWGGLIAGVMALNALPAAAVNDSGLIRALSGPCAGAFQVVGTSMCTHGPDPVSGAFGQRGAGQVIAADTAGPIPGFAAVMCNGDGQTGKRIQAIYAHVSGRPDRRSTYLASFRSWAANVDEMLQGSAIESGGYRHLRWVTDGACLLSVPSVVLSAAAEANFGAMITELAAAGYNRTDRKYLVWFDSDPHNSPICGIATTFPDDRPTLNLNDATTGYARVDYTCWNWSEPHEIMHTLGGVQLSAPHATTGLHCTDEHDQMCYVDAPTAVMSYVCPVAHETRFDCGHDDYFSVVAAPGSYLASHWNTANSGWLVNEPPDTTPPAVSAPRTSFVSGFGLGRTTRVRVAWPAATDSSGIAEYELQRKKGSGAWNSVALASERATSVDLELEVGAKYAFRVRATDGQANTGTWTTTPARTLTLVQEKAAAVAYTSGFKRVALAGASGGYVRKSSAAGSVATFSFSGTEVAFVSTLSPGRGMATVRLDSGASQSLDLFDPATKTRRVVWATSAPTGSHRVEVRISGTANPSANATRVDVDAFLVWKP